MLLVCELGIVEGLGVVARLCVVDNLGKVEGHDKINDLSIVNGQGKVNYLGLVKVKAESKALAKGDKAASSSGSIMEGPTFTHFS